MAQLDVRKDKQSGPVQVYSEDTLIKSSNTWQYLQFQQMNAIRFIQSGIFDNPPQVKFKILNLLTSMAHLESLVWDKIDPTGDQKSSAYQKYMAKKPSLFKDIINNMDRISSMINSNELTQFQLCYLIECWFRAMDESMQGIKRIEAITYTMGTREPTLEGNFKTENLDLGY